MCKCNLAGTKKKRNVATVAAVHALLVLCSSLALFLIVSLFMEMLVLFQFIVIYLAAFICK